MVVVGIIVVMMVLLAPALTNLKGSRDVTSAAYAVSGVLEQARTLALARGTYVWVGFHEEDGSSPAPSPAPSPTPPFPGRGRLILATVFSNDGTEINPLTASGSQTLPPARITQYGKLVKIDGIHMTDVGAPAGSTSNTRPDSLDNRSALPYTQTDVPGDDEYNRLSSDSALQTRFDFVAQGYRFWKSVRFAPRGEARINTSYDYRRVSEIGLRPARGNFVDVNTPNVVAIQFSAFGGDFKVFRK